MDKQNTMWIVVPLVIVLLLGAVVWFSQSGARNGEVPFADHALGNADAPVTLVEYSDFQCPACKRQYPVIKELRKRFSDNELRIVYRHLPLASIHANAIPAARASEAAAMQGMFWEMHDRLFDTQELWANEEDPSGLFRGYAEDLGLNGDQFMQDYESREVRRLVEQHNASARALGLQGTPSFLLNGERIESIPAFDGFETLIRGVVRDARANGDIVVDEASGIGVDAGGAQVIFEDSDGVVVGGEDVTEDPTGASEEGSGVRTKSFGAQ